MSAARKNVVPIAVGRLNNLLSKLGVVAEFEARVKTGEWHCTVTTAVDGKPYSTTGVAGKKQDAESAAAKALFDKLVDDRIAARAVVQMLKDYGGDYATAINEMCHLFGAQKPTYTDPEGDKPFTITCVFTAPSSSCEGVGTGDSKPEARRLAAGDVLLKLRLISEIQPKRQPITSREARLKQERSASCSGGHSRYRQGSTFGHDEERDQPAAT